MQRGPVKRLTGVYFAARRNIAMTENILRRNGVPRRHLLQELNERCHLRFGESRHRAVFMSVMVKLNADRGRVHIRLAAPERDTGVPCARALIDQLENMPVAANEIMRRDFGRRIAQPRQRRFAIGHIGIMQNNVADGASPIVEIGRWAVLCSKAAHNTAPAFCASGFLRPIINTPSKVSAPPSQKRRLNSSPQNITPKIIPKTGAISVSGAVTETS